MTRLPHPQSPLTHHPRRDVYGHQEAFDARYVRDQGRYIQKVLHEREDIGAVEEWEVSDRTVLVLPGLCWSGYWGRCDGDSMRVDMLFLKSMSRPDNTLLDLW